jgi:hypothetical protein
MRNSHYALFKDGTLFAIVKNNPITINESTALAIKDEFCAENITIVGLEDAIRNVNEFKQDVSFSFINDEEDEIILGIEMAWEY